jgi:hypothetical protein
MSDPRAGQPKLTRRDVLKGLAGLAAATALPAGAAERPPAALTGARAPAVRQPEAIRRENARRGTRDWLLQKTGIDPATKYRCPWIEGYCSRTSVRAGESVDLFVSTRPASRFTIDIYRTGYYGGDGARQVSRLGPFEGVAQPDPPIGPRRARECQWTPCARLTIPNDWLSGVYVGKLTADREGWQSYLIFIVRDDRPADFIFQCSDTTWQAYNRWPSQFALYDDGKETWYWGPDVDVSFDRPYGKYCQIFDAPLSTGSGEWLLWEFPLAFWLEQHGYDVTYISNLDTHADPQGLLRAKGFLSVGHDEYYSIEMFNHLQAAIAAGINLAFLSGNTCCGRIDPRPSSQGAPLRVFSRTDFYGPRDEAEIKRFPAMARLPHQSPNANLLLGARSVAPVTGGGPWVCSKPNHWLFAGTGMKAGDGIPGLVGWEWHGDPAPFPGLEIVSTGPTDNGTEKGLYTATLYPGPKSNLVFNASTCWWGDGLSAPPGYVRPAVYTKPQGPDPRAQRITANLLARMRSSP